MQGVDEAPQLIIERVAFSIAPGERPTIDERPRDCVPLALAINADRSKAFRYAVNLIEAFKEPILPVGQPTPEPGHRHTKNRLFSIELANDLPMLVVFVKPRCSPRVMLEFLDQGIGLSTDFNPVWQALSSQSSEDRRTFSQARHAECHSPITSVARGPYFFFYCKPM